MCDRENCKSVHATPSKLLQGMILKRKAVSRTYRLHSLYAYASQIRISHSVHAECHRSLPQPAESKHNSSTTLMHRACLVCMNSISPGEAPRHHLAASITSFRGTSMSCLLMYGPVCEEFLQGLMPPALTCCYIFDTAQKSEKLKFACHMVIRYALVSSHLHAGVLRSFLLCCLCNGLADAWNADAYSA